jgi:hypothetical protein
MNLCSLLISCLPFIHVHGVNGHGGSPSTTIPVEAAVGEETWGRHTAHPGFVGPNGPPSLLGSTFHTCNQLY